MAAHLGFDPPANAITLAEPPSACYNESMSRVEQLEREVAALTQSELAEFRRWYAAFDAAAWDERLEADARSGALDRLADHALAAHREGRSRPV